MIGPCWGTRRFGGGGFLGMMGTFRLVGDSNPVGVVERQPIRVLVALFSGGNAVGLFWHCLQFICCQQNKEVSSTMRPHFCLTETPSVSASLSEAALCLRPRKVQLNAF